MKRRGFRLLATASLFLAALAGAETRPHYGGTLHVCLQAAPVTLDPAEAHWIDARNLFGLIFDRLVTLDDQGQPQPALATAWQAEPGNQRWQFSLRQGVSFSDGAPLTADVVATSLRAANPGWKVFSAGGAVIIERDSPAPELPAELALARNSIVKRDGGKNSGVGPFVVTQWNPGKKLVVTARDDYWGGRPFLDSIELELGESFREEMVSFDLGKAQVIEVAPEQAGRAAAEGRRIELSSPVELVALVFNREPQSLADSKEREALSLSIDRRLLNSVVLQNGGEPGGGLLPNWMSGYGFLFPVEVNLTRAQQERAEVPETTVWNLGFDANDPVARVLAERIVLNARDAGLRLQLATGASDVRLVRVPLVSFDAGIALAQLAAALGLPSPKINGNSVDELYAAENALLKSQRVIPLLHLRRAWAVSKTVKNWSEGRDGSWRLADVWLGAERP
ncbi:MAG: ABC transporter substrate-binding protein [Terriglobales bacterium]